MKIIRISTVSISLDSLLVGQLNFLNKYFEVIAVSNDDGNLNDVHLREGVRVIGLPMRRSIKPLHDLVSLFYLYKLFRKEKPHIIHSITPKAGLLSMIAGKLAGVPIRMHTFTGLVFPSKKGLFKILLIFMDKLLCFCATNVYPEGLGVKKDLINYRITSKKLKILGNGNINGVDTSYFDSIKIPSNNLLQLKLDLSIRKDDFVFLFVGRLVVDKGINELILGFNTFNSIFVNSKLLIVGGFDDLKSPFNNSVCEIINLNSNIIFTGFQKDVRPYFGISNCLVLPSYREGFPNVVIQAGSMNLPCIVTNVSGSNEIIEDNVNGIIIEVKNPNAISEAMAKIFKHSELYFKYKCNSRKMIVTRFEQKFVWSCLLSEYYYLLKHKEK